MLNKKLSNKFQNCLVTIKNAENLKNLIISLRNIDAIVKEISNQSYVLPKLLTPVTFTRKPMSMTIYSTFANLSISVGVTTPSSGFSIAMKTLPYIIKVFNANERWLILQAKKDCYISLGLCYYYTKGAHIPINDKNLTQLVYKSQAVGITNY